MDVSSVEFSKHALEKMGARHVREDQVTETIRNPASLFEDVESNTLVALKRIRNRYLVVVFALRGNKAKVVTVYHASEVDSLIRRKLHRGAWRQKA